MGSVRVCGIFTVTHGVSVRERETRENVGIAVWLKNDVITVGRPTVAMPIAAYEQQPGKEHLFVWPQYGSQWLVVHDCCEMPSIEKLVMLNRRDSASISAGRLK